MFAPLTFPTPLPPLFAASRLTRFCSTRLCVVKRVPCHVLEARTSPVMDGPVVSSGHCFTNGNPEPQPSCHAMDDAASSVHDS
jgi:hypothetical protein